MQLIVIPNSCNEFYNELINNLENFDNFVSIILEKKLPLMCFEEEDEKFYLIKSSLEMQSIIKKNLSMSLIGVKDLGRLELPFSEYNDLINSQEVKEKIDAFENKKIALEAEKRHNKRIDDLIGEYDEEG